jgi:signal transduction histidine kinase
MYLPRNKMQIRANALHTLTLRIYLTVVVVLLAFALGSGWLFTRQVRHERARAQAFASDRMAAWADLIDHALPGPQTSAVDQAAALLEWSHRLRLPMALDNPAGERIATAPAFQKRHAQQPGSARAIRLDDGRTLWVMRLERLASGRFEPPPPGEAAGSLPLAWRRLFPPGVGLATVLIVLFIAIAAGAWPVVRQLTRRLDSLKHGMEKFGAGDLAHRVDIRGRDEVAAVARSFNHAAERIESLVGAHRSLLANASHELRSPLARLKMAASLLEPATDPLQRQRLGAEIHTNVAELDALVEEVLLASRLDAAPTLGPLESVDLLALAAEEGARVGALVEGDAVVLPLEERLIRRAVRNLLENAQRYGAGEIMIQVQAAPERSAIVRVLDRGPGIPPHLAERIFEPFYRLPGHAEQAGGVGLGLSLVKQIAQRHSGSVHCIARDGGGSCFVLRLGGLQIQASRT